METLSKAQILRRSVVSTLMTFVLALSAGVTVVGNDWTSWGLSSQVGGLPAQPVAAAEFTSSVYVFNNRLLSDGSSFLEAALLSHICVGPSCTVPNWLALGEVPGSRTSLTASSPAAAVFNNQLYLLVEGSPLRRTLSWFATAGSASQAAVRPWTEWLSRTSMCYGAWSLSLRQASSCKS